MNAGGPFWPIFVTNLQSQRRPRVGLFLSEVRDSVAVVFVRECALLKLTLYGGIKKWVSLPGVSK